ncbi:MAG: hypothetical protein DMG59_10590 [Acidobacteria bacterium]|jgi:PAS domain S-box-containing protein|nr:MAG: hypothetical protein DMG59_10590 [Acidobacteriota bacterium]
MLWLYLLGIVTFLIIVLRRVLRKQKPLHDELYSKKVAIEYVYTGVAWVGEDSKLGSVNPALARALQIDQNSLIGRDWYEIFAVGDRNQVREAYKQMLLMGKASLEVRGLRADGSFALFDVLLVAVHDHKTRLVGHHCLTKDRTREHELEQRVEELSGSAV